VVIACYAATAPRKKIISYSWYYDFFIVKGVGKNGVLKASNFCVVAMFVALDL
jgi:hypothetical protein